MATFASMFNMDFGKYSNCNITNTSKSVGRAEIEIEVDFIADYNEIFEYEKILAYFAGRPCNFCLGRL